MHNLLLDPKIIASEREVVIEERRTRTEDDPGGALGEEVGATAFRAHPYGTDHRLADRPGRITPEEIRAFYRTYFCPNNALLVVVGDFKAADALAKVAGDVRSDPSRRRAAGGPRRGAAPEQRAAGAGAEACRAADRVPGLPGAEPEIGGCRGAELLSVILSGGRSLALYRDLVHDRQLALEAGGDYSYFSIDPNLFWFWATPLPGQTPETLEKELLGAHGAAQARAGERGRAHARQEPDRGRLRLPGRLDPSSGSLLARFELIGGYALKDYYLASLRAVSAADLQRVAGAYFQDDKKNVGTLLPKAAEPPPSRRPRGAARRPVPVTVITLFWRDQVEQCRWRTS